MHARDRILDAAVQVYAAAGSKGATTRRIAEVAGVNEVTLFRQFGCKDRLLREALERAAGVASTAGLPCEPKDPENELASWAVERLNYLYARRSLLRRSIGEFEQNPEGAEQACEAPRRGRAELRHYLERLRDLGIVREDADTAIAAAVLTGSIFADAIGRDVMPDQYPFSLEDAARSYARLCLRAIAR